MATAVRSSNLGRPQRTARTGLEPLRFEQRVRQVAQQQQSYDSANDVFLVHSFSRVIPMALKRQGGERHRQNEDCYSKRPLLLGHDSSSYTRSQKRTYQNDKAKKTMTTATKIRSNISSSSWRSDPYHGPCLRPTHQISPTVAVFWSFFRSPGVSVRKNGRSEKSRRHSLRTRKPSASL